MVAGGLSAGDSEAKVSPTGKGKVLVEIETNSNRYIYDTYGLD